MHICPRLSHNLHNTSNLEREKSLVEFVCVRTELTPRPTKTLGLPLFPLTWGWGARSQLPTE